MLVSFNTYLPNVNYKQKPSFKSLKDGFIIASEVAKISEAKILPGIIGLGGGYKPTIQNFKKNLSALEDAKIIAAKDKYLGEDIIDHLNDAIEVLKQKAKEAGIIQ